MSEEVENEVRQVSDELEALSAVNTEPEELDAFLERIGEFKARHSTSAYNKFQVKSVNKKGETVFLIEGLRDETEQECGEREAREAQEKQRVEQAELKEYLRLKKKYGKKGEQ